MHLQERVNSLYKVNGNSNTESQFNNNKDDDLSKINSNDDSSNIVHTKYRGECNPELIKPLINAQHFTINTSDSGSLKDCLPTFSMKKPTPPSKSHLQAKVYNFLERPTGW